MGAGMEYVGSGEMRLDRSVKADMSSCRKHCAKDFAFHSVGTREPEAYGLSVLLNISLCFPHPKYQSSQGMIQSTLIFLWNSHRCQTQSFLWNTHLFFPSFSVTLWITPVSSSLGLISQTPGFISAACWLLLLGHSLSPES